MKVLDLFAGIGGFSLAAHWMGWQTVAFVEKEPYCQKVLDKNFPGIPIYDDIREFSGQPFRGSIDLITGGFPCQPFSTSGKRKGTDDQRHLWPEMLRVVSEVRPSWVVAENVRGLLSVQDGSVFTDILTQLEDEGYELITFNLPASAVEAHHERQRIWVIAHDPERAGCEGRTGSNAALTDSDGAKDRLLEQADSDACDAPHTISQGLQGSIRPQEPSVLAKNTWSRHWIEAATVFCRMDDGVPEELDIVGSRDNRIPRLRGLGNAIVPQLAYEIFRAIDNTFA